MPIRSVEVFCGTSVVLLAGYSEVSGWCVSVCVCARGGQLCLLNGMVCSDREREREAEKREKEGEREKQRE